jgi:hypothetical protein
MIPNYGEAFSQLELQLEGDRVEPSRGIWQSMFVEWIVLVALTSCSLDRWRSRSPDPSARRRHVKTVGHFRADNAV